MFKYKMVVNGDTVHSDKRIPLSRSCPMGYGVDKVYNINGKPLLFIRYKRIGFEGPDFRTITLPLK
ncbi:MAG: DUF2259 domain-containing protein [Bdellovibrionaceae bacterium]|nr:DUF2259 domain-containing protein [Pseudobdellovibrionaceae bacterium]